jgi:predicted small lipoprotein YifL
MMKSPLPIAAALVSLVALAGCNSKSEQPQVIDTNPDPMASTLANAAPVELPPAIKADKTMRCKDGSLVYVTSFTGDKQAVVRTEKGGTPTTLKADEAGKPLTADGGWSMTGNTDAVELKVPGKGDLNCHA